MFWFLASSNVSYNDTFDSFNVWTTSVLKTSSPAANAAAPIASDGRSGILNACYGTANFVLPSLAVTTSLFFILSP